MKYKRAEVSLEAVAFFSSVGIQCYDIIPPIESNVYCVKDKDSQWAAFRIGDSHPIVPFGKYNYMWGYDKGYCLVSVTDEYKIAFANRGIIDAKGNEIIKPYTFRDIFNFYGKGNSHVLVLTHDGTPMNIPIVSLKLL